MPLLAHLPALGDTLQFTDVALQQFIFAVYNRGLCWIGDTTLKTQGIGGRL
jgi:hypothetical protein